MKKQYLHVIDLEKEVQQQLSPRADHSDQLDNKHKRPILNAHVAIAIACACACYHYAVAVVYTVHCILHYTIELSTNSTWMSNPHKGRGHLSCNKKRRS